MDPDDDLDAHDGDTEPFAFVVCPSCGSTTAFPLLLATSPCDTCGGKIDSVRDVSRGAP